MLTAPDCSIPQVSTNLKTVHRGSGCGPVSRLASPIVGIGRRKNERLPVVPRAGRGPLPQVSRVAFCWHWFSQQARESARSRKGSNANALRHRAATGKCKTPGKPWLSLSRSACKEIEFWTLQLGTRAAWVNAIERTGYQRGWAAFQAQWRSPLFGARVEQGRAGGRWRALGALGDLAWRAAGAKQGRNTLGRATVLHALARGAVLAALTHKYLPLIFNTILIYDAKTPKRALGCRGHVEGHLRLRRTAAYIVLVGRESSGQNNGRRPTECHYGKRERAVLE